VPDSSGVSDASGDDLDAIPALTGPAMAGIARLSATDTVRARIELAIDLELLSAGEKLPSDARIAEALDVSEITARRALESLAEDGTLLRRRGRGGGTFVSDSKRHASGAVDVYRADASEVHRLIDLRILLESALLHHAALRATPQQVAELESHVRAAGAAENWSEYHLADERFHTGLAVSSGLPWAVPHYMEVLTRLYRYFIPYPIEQLLLANHDHERILDAVRRHDPVDAVAEISAHVAALHSTMFVGYPDGRTDENA
jgi:GntR family transcriptional repressor for pyruvate dehydrogenase complex